MKNVIKICCDKLENSALVRYDAYENGMIIYDGQYDYWEKIKYCPFCGNKFETISNEESCKSNLRMR